MPRLTTRGPGRPRRLPCTATAPTAPQTPELTPPRRPADKPPVSQAGCDALGGARRGIRASPVPLILSPSLRFTHLLRCAAFAPAHIMSENNMFLREITARLRRKEARLSSCVTKREAFHHPFHQSHKLNLCPGCVSVLRLRKRRHMLYLGCALLGLSVMSPE